MDNSFIKTVIEIEALHRYCFNNLYIQSYQITDEDKRILNKYNSSCNNYPGFKQDCAKSLIFLSELERSLTLKELELITKLKHINFRRYSINKKLIERIKLLK